MPRVHRQNLVIEPGKPRLALADDLGLERRISIARRFQFQFPKLPFQLLLALAVRRVAALIPDRIVLLVPKVLGHLGLQCSLQHGFRQLLQ